MPTLIIGWIENRAVLQSLGNCSQHPVIDGKERTRPKIKQNTVLNFKIKGLQVPQAYPPIRESTSLGIHTTIFMAVSFLSVLMRHLSVCEYIINLVDLTGDK